MSMASKKSFLPERFRTVAVIEKSQIVAQHSIGGETRKIAMPVTFTPFASVKPCTARCQFCSEALVHKEATVLSASLRPKSTYGHQLRRAFQELRGLSVGLSLSGLEATAEKAWFLDVLQAAIEHEKAGGQFDEKILYSNGTGLAVAPGNQEVLKVLEDLELTRIEMSRHSPDLKRNDAIMRFRDQVAVSQLPNFEIAVRTSLQYVPVKLVCVIQRAGVETMEEVENYLNWAHSLGVDTVVFRELSRLHDLYKPNITAKYVESARLPIEPLVDEAFLNPAFEAQEITDGYYYWNAKFRWKKKMSAIFETSDYLLMKQLHHSDVIYKMVFHANGNLCADWYPNTRVLMEIPA
jgi:hypothetical protein